jgi:hypothetical protein
VVKSGNREEVIANGKHYYNRIDADWIKTKYFRISDLRKVVDFKKPFTLRHLMLFLDTSVRGDLVPKIFESLFGATFRAYFEEMNRTPPPSKKKIPKFKKIVLEMFFEKSTHGCYSSWEVLAEIEKPQKERICIDFSPLCLLKDCVIEVSPKMLFCDNSKPNTTVRFRKIVHQITFFELIDNLFYHLGRFRTQESKDAFEGMLDQRMEDFKAGKTFAIPAEEVYAKLKKKFEAKKG